ncbi:pentapeptide repeat-containing protein [Halorubrum lipolyticum]|uniref:Pentapeptide repeat-containing protein n=1 Tax=Halorubrum lipolyticum DSM 21995 TaxID=1227482 RepID=M0NVS5_9EURY|nr:pentapeptide repeat-containing protein [Halorubrum lipolyticum]EMA60680.1 pentapeptide repeat-containing protein [Halorubrum lipolyticum DSM 21995]
MTRGTDPETAEPNADRREGTCDYSLPVPDYLESYPWLDETPNWGIDASTPGVRDGAWRCPHDAEGGADYCAFHRDAGDRSPDAESVSTLLIRRIEAANETSDPERRRRMLQFIGARLGRLDFESQVVGGESRSTIDLRHASIGAVSCRRTEFRQPIDFSAAVFDSGAAPPESPGREVLDPALEQIPFGIDFTHADFADIVRFDGTTFRRPALFRDAEFDHPTSFGDARFRDHVSFLTADFRDIVMFDDARFRRDVRLQACECVDLVDFKRSYVGGRLNLDRVVCRGDVELDEANLADRPPDADDRWLETTAGRVTADMAVVTGRLSCNEVAFGREIRVREAEIGRLRLREPETDGAAAYVDLARSTIGKGTLGQPPAGGSVIYDLHRTTLGNVRFESDPDTTVIDRIRFHRTEYDGFDFTDDDALDLDAASHRIHGFSVDAMSVPCYCGDGSEHEGRFIVDDPACPRHDREFGHGAMQATYAYAKNGADDAGDNASAGSFFYREMCAHRYEHRYDALTRGAGPIGRVAAATRWGRSALLAATTGYGERPYLVVVSSFVVVAAFGSAYWAADLLRTEYTVIEAFVFSFQSFVAFVLGPPDGATLYVEALSAIQGFIGAFLIALFVFAFTRRIHR